MKFTKKFGLAIFAILLVAIYSGFAASKKTNPTVEFFKACRNNDEKTVEKILKKTPSFANATLTQDEWNEYVKFRYEYNKVNEKGFDKTFEKYVEDLGDDFYKTLSPLYEACCGKNPTKTVKFLLDAGAEANAKNNDGWTALMVASANGHKEVVELLFSKGAEVNAKTNNGWTALMHASQNGHKEVVELLLSKGAEVNAKDNDDWTALMIASSNGHKEVVEILISKGAEVNAKKNNGLTALIIASANGHKEVAEILISKGADVNAKDSNGWTSLIYASQKGHKEVVELLISKGTEVNAKDNNGCTALIIASLKGYKEVVELLLSKGVNINAKDNNGWTALMGASQNGHKEVAEVLISKGADVKVKNNGDANALIIASAHGHKEIAEVLLSKGADVNAKDNTGWSALLYAMQYGQEDIAELLISKGAKISEEDFVKVCKDGKTNFVQMLLLNNKDFANAKDGKGSTALMMACVNGNKEIIELLINNGADVNARVDGGVTAVLIAAMDGHLDIVKLLVQNNADFSMVVKGGENAIVALTKEEHPEIAEFIKQKVSETLAKKRYRAEDFEYTITKDGKGVRITGIVGTEAGVEVTIPATIEGLPVTEVELGLHYYGSSPKILKGFECSSNIKRIRFDGIVDCVLKLPSCRSLDFGECEFVNTTLTLIKEWNGAEDLYFGESNIEKLIIQEGFKVIRNGRHKRANSFNGCKKLKEIVVPGTVKMIDFRGEEEWLFGMEYVDGQQFRGCTSLPIRAQALLRQLGYKGEF